MPIQPDQKEKFRQFYDLHHSDTLLILPNIWDNLGALLLQNLGYAAIATASAAIAFTNGYNDGEKIPFNDLLAILKRIAAVVNIPVTADVESGFAETEDQLEENMRQLFATGIAGINFEDTDKKTNELFPVEAQCGRIRRIKKVSADLGVPIFINARTDVYLRGHESVDDASKLEQVVKRGIAYKAAGSDCFFPLAVQKGSDIKTIVSEVQMPVNVLLIAGVPEISTLQQIGVKRISLGPGFLKIAIKSMKDLAVKLREHEGLADISGNEITSNYLIDLVSSKP